MRLPKSLLVYILSHMGLLIGIRFVPPSSLLLVFLVHSLVAGFIYIRKQNQFESLENAWDRAICRGHYGTDGYLKNLDLYHYDYRMMQIISLETAGLILIISGVRVFEQAHLESRLGSIVLIIPGALMVGLALYFSMLLYSCRKFQPSGCSAR